MRASVPEGVALLLVGILMLYLLRDAVLRLIQTALEILGVLLGIALVLAGIFLIAKGYLFR